MSNWTVFWRWLLDFLWLFFLLILFRHFWLDRKRLKKAQSWFITKGQITEFLWTQEGYRLWPKVIYIYQIIERKYQSEQLFQASYLIDLNGKYAREVAYSAAMAYEKNKEITVYYNPDNPEEAVLDIRMPPRLTLILLLLSLLILLHLVIMLFRFF